MRACNQRSGEVQSNGCSMQKRTKRRARGSHGGGSLFAWRRLFAAWAAWPSHGCIISMGDVSRVHASWADWTEQSFSGLYCVGPVLCVAALIVCGSVCMSLLTWWSDARSNQLTQREVMCACVGVGVQHVEQSYCVASWSFCFGVMVSWRASAPLQLVARSPWGCNEL